MKKAFIISLSFIFVCCSDNNLPKEILDIDTMAKVSYDLLKANEFVNNFASKDTAVNIKQKRSVLYEQIFRLHNTTRKEFYTSYKYYQEHPDIQKSMFDSLMGASNKEKAAQYNTKPANSIKEK